MLTKSFLKSCALTLSTSLAMSSTLAVSAHAQDSAGRTYSDEAIVVTAKSRAEKLQDVPLSITALTNADLNDAQIRDVRDLQNVTPNLSLFSGAGRNEPTAWSVRGLAANTSDERFQGISFFLDGIALSGQLSSLDMENIERIEVIKGPQSATFGRATYSGAVNFVTREPTTDVVTGSVRVRGSATEGSNEPSYFFNGSLTAPLVKDQLWLSVAGTTLRNGRFNRARDTGGPIGRERSDIVTGTLFWRPSETTSVRLRGNYSHDRDSVAAQVVQHPRDWVNAGVPLVTLPRGVRSFLPSILPDPDATQVADKGEYGVNGTARDRYFASLIVSQEIGDYSLVYRGGYFNSKEDRKTPWVPRASGEGVDPVFGDLFSGDDIKVDKTGNLNAFTSATEKFVNTSHQIELLSPGDQSLRWRLGAYYFWEGNDFYNYGFANSYISTFIVENFAGFGGFDWDVAPGLTLSGEGRIAHELQKYPKCIVCGIPNAKDDQRASTAFSPRITLNYKLAPDNMIYALYSNGLKSGRYSNVTPVGGAQKLIYAEPEKLDNFEIGSKNAFFDRRLVLNAAGFFNRVTNQQLTSSTPYRVEINDNTETRYLTETLNVGASDIWGFELESSFRVTPRFTLTGSVGHAKQKFTHAGLVNLAASSAVGFDYVEDAGNSIIMKGKTQANVPAWNGYTAAEYVVPTAKGDLSFRLDGTYRGSFYADLANHVLVKSSWTMNSKISLTNGDFDISLFGRNLNSNKRAIGSGLAGATTLCGFTERDVTKYGSNQQCLYATPRRGREIGVEAAFRF